MALLHKNGIELQHEIVCFSKFYTESSTKRTKKNQQWCFHLSVYTEHKNAVQTEFQWVVEQLKWFHYLWVSISFRGCLKAPMPLANSTVWIMHRNKKLYIIALSINSIIWHSPKASAQLLTTADSLSWIKQSKQSQRSWMNTYLWFIRLFC